MLSKASARMYILRVCKYYGYSISEVHQLFNSLIMPIFLYGIKVWGGAYQSKYIDRIDKFFKRAFRFGYISKCTSFQDVIKKKDIHLRDKVMSSYEHCLRELLPPTRNRTNLRNRGHSFILPHVKTERFKRCFVNRCRFGLI